MALSKRTVMHCSMFKVYNCLPMLLQDKFLKINCIKETFTFCMCFSLNFFLIDIQQNRSNTVKVSLFFEKKSLTKSRFNIPYRFHLVIVTTFAIDFLKIDFITRPLHYKIYVTNNYNRNDAVLAWIFQIIDKHTSLPIILAVHMWLKGGRRVTAYVNLERYNKVLHVPSKSGNTFMIAKTTKNVIIIDSSVQLCSN